MQSVIVYGADERLLLLNSDALQEYFDRPVVLAGGLGWYPDDGGFLILTNYVPTLAERRFKHNIISIKRARQLLGRRWRS